MSEKHQLEWRVAERLSEKRQQQPDEHLAYLELLAEMSHRLIWSVEGIRGHELLRKLSSGDKDVSEHLWIDLDDFCDYCEYLASSGVLSNLPTRGRRDIARAALESYSLVVRAESDIGEKDADVSAPSSVSYEELDRDHYRLMRVYRYRLAPAVRRLEALLRGSIVDVVPTLVREIEFPAEFRSAGLQLLSHFPRWFDQRHGEVDGLAIAIAQEGSRVRLEVRSPEGLVEVLEEDLADYGLMILGDKSPNEVAPDHPAAADEMEFRLKQAENEFELAGMVPEMKGSLDEFKTQMIQGLTETPPVAITVKNYVSLRGGDQNVEATANSFATLEIDGLQQHLRALIDSVERGSDLAAEAEWSESALNRVRSAPAEVTAEDRNRLLRFLTSIGDDSTDLGKLAKAANLSAGLVENITNGISALLPFLSAAAGWK